MVFSYVKFYQFICHIGSINNIIESFSLLFVGVLVQFFYCNGYKKFLIKKEERVK